MIRSLLYVPANSSRFVGRAHERGADAIILDLEDAVAPGEKAAARAALAEAVPAVGRGGAMVFVRVNSGQALEADAEPRAAPGQPGCSYRRCRRRRPCSAWARSWSRSNARPAVRRYASCRCWRIPAPSWMPG